MSRLMYIYAPGGTALDSALPKLHALADVILVPLFPVPSGAAAVAAALGTPVLDPVPLRDEELVTDLVTEARARGVTGIMALSEFALVTAARVADRLGLPGAGPNVLRARDKLAMRQAWAEAGVPNPGFRAVHSAHDVAEAVTAFGEPVLLKSRSSAGSIGHVVVRQAAEAAPAWEAARRSIERARAAGMADPATDVDTTAMLAETLIPSTTRSWYSTPGYGDYLSVEGLVVDGRYHPVCITGRLPTIAPFTELSNQAPCVLPEPLQRLIEAQGRRAVDALGLRTCGTHTELKLHDGNGVCLLESAARLGGAMVTREVEAVFGVDLVTELARALLGQPVDPPDRMLTAGHRAAASVALISTDSQGRPWQQLPSFDPARVEHPGWLSPGSRAEVVPAQSIPPGTPMPRYDGSSGVLNFAGLLFLEAPDPATLLRDTYTVLDGLEAVLSATGNRPTGENITAPVDDPAILLDEHTPPADEVVELFAAANLNGRWTTFPACSECSTNRSKSSPPGPMPAFLWVWSGCSQTSVSTPSSPTSRSGRNGSGRASGAAWSRRSPPRTRESSSWCIRVMTRARSGLEKDSRPRRPAW